MKRLIDILPKIPQYEDIPYTGDFECPDCGKSGFYDYGFKHIMPKVVGWCDTNIGYMAVFECPECGQKYRFHCTLKNITDVDEFDRYLYYKAKRCINWNEIKEKLKDD